MLRPIYNKWFITAVILYFVLRLGRLGYYPLHEWLNSYATDVLCMPIILALALTGTRFLKQDATILLTPVMIVGMTLFYSLLFEGYLPLKNPNYTADLGDVIAYFLGATIYFLMQYNIKKSTLRPFIN